MALYLVIKTRFFQPYENFHKKAPGHKHTKAM